MVGEVTSSVLGSASSSNAHASLGFVADVVDGRGYDGSDEAVDEEEQRLGDGSDDEPGGGSDGGVCTGMEKNEETQMIMLKKM